MKLDKEISRVLVLMNPKKYQMFVDEDGCIWVKLKKALYGCLDSAKLWYETLRNALVKFGLEKNPHDYCVFNKVYNVNGKPVQLTVGVYVDDLFITCANKEIIEKFLEFLKKEFKEISINRGLQHSYLGMMFDFAKERGKVHVNMNGFVEDIIKKRHGVGIAKSPANNALFASAREEKLNKLADPGEAKRFHSIVASLQYLAKRCRPDILTAVAYLSTRVTKPTVSDVVKLERVLGYLTRTKEYGIVLEHLHDYPVAHIDASHSVHEDLRGQSGLFMTTGKGPIMVRSSKQTILGKSSTASEIIAVGHNIDHVLWAKDFLSHQQGYKYEGQENWQEPAVIMQDNMSTIQIMMRGEKFASAAKWRSVRTLIEAIRGHVKDKEVNVKYLPTKEMVADILTKPLQGKLYRKLRTLILNISQSSE